jgi:hypothetical protein
MRKFAELDLHLVANYPAVPAKEASNLYASQILLACRIHSCAVYC